MNEPFDPVEYDEPTAPVSQQPVIVQQPPAAVEPPPAPKKPFAEQAREWVNNAYNILRMVVFLVLGFAIAIFVIRNWSDVEFDFVFGEVEIPLAAIMLIFLLIGMALGIILVWLGARKRRH